MKRLLLASLLLGLIPPANAADTCNFISEYYSDVTIEIINGETLSFCKPYIISTLEVVAVRIIASVTQRVIFIKIETISSKPVL